MQRVEPLAVTRGQRKLRVVLMRLFSCDVCDATSPGAPGAGWLTVTQHNDADHGGDVTLHYCSPRCCEDDLDSLDLGGES